ncbi:MAG: hypothetical protein N2595_00385 [bacterium]|nr:hypothetical protein [bacterium]
MKHTMLVFVIVPVTLAAAYAGVLRAVTQMYTLVNYQGIVEIEGGAYTGDGYFKFAFSDASGVSNLWANDSQPVGEPQEAIMLSLTNGFFTIALGNPTLMHPLPRNVFVPGTDVWLTVWFSFIQTGTYAQLGPRQRVLPVPTAVNADMLDGFDYETVVANATNVALSSAVTTFTNMFLLKAGDTCTGQLRISNVIVDTTLDVTGGDVSIAPGQRVYLDGRDGNTYITRNNDGTVSIYKGNQPILVIE